MLVVQRHQHFENVPLGPGVTRLPGMPAGDCLEIDAVFEPGAEAECGYRTRWYTQSN